MPTLQPSAVKQRALSSYNGHNVADERAKPVETAVRTCLPPLVAGAVRGHLRVCVGPVLWQHTVGPPASRLWARLKWWGEQSLGTAFRVAVSVEADRPAIAVAYFPVCSALAQLKVYLKDMGGLTFQLGLGHMTEDSLVIGQCHVPDVAALLPASTLRGRFPVVSASGSHLGQLSLDMRLEMRQPLHSGPAPSSDQGGFPKENTRVFQSAEQSALVRRGGEGGEGVMAGRQLEVISDLLARGRRLRDAMVQSLAASQHTSTEKEKLEPADVLSLLSAEVEREQRRQCNRGKAQQDAATSVVELSGSEEGSSGDDFSDLSMTDSDLHRASLLQEFLYSEEPARETALASKPHINIAKVVIAGREQCGDLPSCPPSSEGGRNGGTVPPPQPVRLKEKATGSQDTPLTKPIPLQLLMLIPEGTAMSAPPSLQQLGTPAPPQLNCFLVCRLFCAASHHPRTAVQWATSEPQFDFRQVYTLSLTPALMEQVCNNFTVVEVWNRASCEDNELVGLAKVSLHQFYMAYSHHSSAQLCLQAQLPVIAVDSYCAVVDPLTGAQCGHLAVLLALGSSQQVASLQQQLASGAYTLHRPQRAPPRRALLHKTAPTPQHSNSRDVRHVFVVCVRGVKGVAAFTSCVWGEADCFVQYHFPASQQRDHPTAEMWLATHCTDTTLCVPDPAFCYEACHALHLPPSCPLTRELLTVCGGGVNFELWRRFYHPNIREQLVATASLPISRLCAMVSMHRTAAAASVQSFTLPLTGVTGVTSQGGLLDITVSYEVCAGDQLHVWGSLSDSHTALRETGRKAQEVPNSIPPASHATVALQVHESSLDTGDRESAASEEVEEDETPSAEACKDMFEARVVIHQALHLPLSSHAERPPSACVSVHPHPSVARLCTPVGEASRQPVWAHQCTTHVPRLYLDAHCPGLEFQVWDKGAGPGDGSHIGSAHVDLSPLSYGLGVLCGWYNISDFGGQVRGQLKVSVAPTQRLSFPSTLLSTPAHVSSSSVLSAPEEHSRSLLVRQLRESVSQLEHIHHTLQTKLSRTEANQPSTAPLLSALASGGEEEEASLTGACPPHTSRTEDSPLTEDKPYLEIKSSSPVAVLYSEECSESQEQAPAASSNNSTPSSLCESADLDALDASSAPAYSCTHSSAASLTDVSVCNHSLSVDGVESTSCDEAQPTTALPETVCSSDPPAPSEELVGSDTPQSSLEGDAQYAGSVTRPEKPAVEMLAGTEDVPAVSLVCVDYSVGEHCLPLYAADSLPRLATKQQPADSCLPNFFMPPQQLEQSMRLLRASTLARPPPHRQSPPTANTLQSWKQVSQYLEQRREAGSLGGGGGAMPDPTATHRIARILSSS